MDLHSHILPGLDDGPDGMEESMAILSRLSELGFTTVFATPHHRMQSWKGLSSEQVEKGVRDLRGESVKSGLGMALYPGMEYDLDDGLEEWVTDRPLMCRHVLVDPGFYHVPLNMTGILGPLREAGLLVLIVHPERNTDLLRKKNDLNSLEWDGFGFLGNLGSLSGMYGKAAKNRCLEYLESGKYWALATDIHSINQVNYIERGLHELGKRVGSQGLSLLMKDNPMTLVREMEDRA